MKIRVKDIKKGDVIREWGYGEHIDGIAKADAVTSIEGEYTRHEVVLDINGKEQQLLETEEYPAYWLDLEKLTPNDGGEE